MSRISDNLEDYLVNDPDGEEPDPEDPDERVVSNDLEDYRVDADGEDG